MTMNPVMNLTLKIAGAVNRLIQIGNIFVTHGPNCSNSSTWTVPQLQVMILGKCQQQQGLLEKLMHQSGSDDTATYEVDELLDAYHPYNSDIDNVTMKGGRQIQAHSSTIMKGSPKRILKYSTKQDHWPKTKTFFLLVSKKVKHI